MLRIASPVVLMAFNMRRYDITMNNNDKVFTKINIAAEYSQPYVKVHKKEWSTRKSASLFVNHVIFMSFTQQKKEPFYTIYI